MYGICEKCGNETWMEEHHIVPQAKKTIKMNNNDVSYLCPTCHTEYHHHLGFKNLKGKSVKYYNSNFYQWLLGIVIFILYLYFQ